MNQVEKVSVPIVYVVDDDPQTCRAVSELVTTLGHQVKAFETAEEFLEAVDGSRPGCVILDLRLPDANGTELHQELTRRNLALPVIVLTAYADTSTTVRSLRNGAITVLDKPYRDNELWNFLQEAIAKSEREYRRANHQKKLEERLKKLSPQDRSVLQLMMQGMKNRTIATRLNVSLRTVENRRRRVFEVMKADSVAQLTRMVVEFEHNLLPNGSQQEAWLNLPFERAAAS